MANMRAWHGLTFNANYTYSRAIDDAGNFRSGYAIPAGTIVNEPNTSFPADRMERTVSTSNQPQHLVVTTFGTGRSARRFSRLISRSGRFSRLQVLRNLPGILRLATVHYRIDLPDQSIGRYLFSHSQPELQRIGAPEWEMG